VTPGQDGYGCSNLKFVERGNDMPSQEEGSKIYPRYHEHNEIFQPD